MKPNILYGLMDIAGALLIIGPSIPLVMHKIKMNDFYGIRIRKAFKSEENWYKINEYGGKEFIIWFIPIFLAGIISFFIPIDGQNKETLYFALCDGPIMVCVAIAVIRIFIYASRM